MKHASINRIKTTLKGKEIKKYVYREYTIMRK